MIRQTTKTGKTYTEQWRGDRGAPIRHPEDQVMSHYSSLVEVQHQGKKDDPKGGTMTFDTFKDEINLRFGRAYFRHIGEHGWSHIANGSEGIQMDHGQPGPHWCDAIPVPSTGKVLGSYNFNTSIATFYQEASNDG